MLQSVPKSDQSSLSPLGRSEIQKDIRYNRCVCVLEYLWKKRSMGKTEITIDVDRLRNDLRNEDLGAYFGGGFGGALMEALDIDNATPQELVRVAQDRGVDLRMYMVEE